MQPMRTLSRLAPLCLTLVLTGLAVPTGATAAGRTTAGRTALDSGPAATGASGRGPADPAAASPPFANCHVGWRRVTHVMAGRNWQPQTPSKWQFPGSEVILSEAGTQPPGPRRPFEFAVLAAGPEFGSVQIDAEVRLDTPVEIVNRDVIIVFGYQSPTQYYYAHFSTDNTIYAHNGIFKVDNADRFRLDDQWNGSTGAPPAITDAEYHKVRVRHCADSGEIAVYVDGSRTPLMTAADHTFRSGRIGFGSFDNIGRMRALTVTGTPACRDERGTAPAASNGRTPAATAAQPA